jgi:peptidoglycan hydrolase CwlO-like protein
MENIVKKSSNLIEKISIKTTRWIGSTFSILIHTILFFLAFSLYFLGIDIQKILLVVTTIVSLEAIYLSIFIQMSVNRQTRRLHTVARDVEEIQEDVEELTEDVGEIQEDVAELGEGIEEDAEEEKESDRITRISIDKIEMGLQKIISEIEAIKTENGSRKNRKIK